MIREVRSYVAFTPVRKHTYVVKIVAGNIHGDFANRTLTLITK